MVDMVDMVGIESLKKKEEELQYLKDLKAKLDGALGKKKFISPEEVAKLLGTKDGKQSAEHHDYVEWKRDAWPNTMLTKDYVDNLAKRYNEKHKDDGDKANTKALLKMDGKKPHADAIAEAQRLLGVEPTGTMDKATEQAIINDKKEYWVDGRYNASTKEALEKSLREQERFLGLLKKYDAKGNNNGSLEANEMRGVLEELKQQGGGQDCDDHGQKSPGETPKMPPQAKLPSNRLHQR